MDAVRPNDWVQLLVQGFARVCAPVLALATALGRQFSYLVPVRVDVAEDLADAALRPPSRLARIRAELALVEKDIEARLILSVFGSGVAVSKACWGISPLHAKRMRLRFGVMLMRSASSKRCPRLGTQRKEDAPSGLYQLNR